MIRVAHLITGLQTGGAERMLARLVCRMDPSRFSNTVISMTGADTVGAELVASGIPTLSLGMRRGTADPLGLMRLIDILQKIRPHILQTWLYHADLMGTIAGRLTATPKVVWNIRCSDMDMHNYSRLSRRIPGLLAKLSRFPATVVVNSACGQATHQKYGYQPRSWSLIPNGFDTERFRPDPDARAWLRQHLGMTGDELIIALPARFDPMKDHMTFLAAAANLAAKDDRIRFLLIGRGLSDNNPQISRRVAACGLGDRVRLLGERSDMPRMLAGADIVTLSSAFGEGFPNILGEAMACGTPCVSTDVGDAAAIIADTGITVPSRDPTALSLGWQRLIDTGAETRAALGRQGRERILSRYALPVIIDQYAELYTTLAAPQAR